MLELAGVRKSYRNGFLATEALRGVSLTVERGDFVSIMGPSGSGKTTLLNILGLLEEVDDGEYRLDGASVRGLDDAAQSRLRNRSIGFVFQSCRFVAGGAWPQRADFDADARLAVITDAVARRWFGRTDVVGRDVDVDGVRFSIVGVVAYDEAQPYDLRFTPDGEELFIPWAQGSALGLGADLALPRGGFVHVSAAGDVSRLGAIARLMPCAELWDRAHIWDPGLFWISLLALAALGGCTFNLARLLLAKFIAQPRPASIRRAPTVRCFLPDAS